MNSQSNLIIWWLCEYDYKFLEEDINSDESRFKIGKKYIQDEVANRYGRPGRGRLWVNKYIDKYYGNISCSESEGWNTPLGKQIGNTDNAILNDYGGIVIEKQDYQYIRFLPGIITNMNLERYAG